MKGGDNDGNDSHVITVNPYTLPETNNSKLLSLLKPFTPKPSATNETPVQSSNNIQLDYSIPVLKSIDVSHLIKLNDTRILTQKSQQSIQKGSSKTANASTDDIVDENEQPQYLKPINELMPTNLKDQISLIIIKNFPNFKPISIEKLLLLLIDLDDGDDNKRGFTWSLVNYDDYVDKKLIFIRFNHLIDVKWFVETYTSAPLSTFFENDQVQIITDPNLTSHLEEIDAVTASKIPDLIQARIQIMLTNPKHFQKSKKTGTEDLDEVLAYYSNYQVDKSELIDVPTHMREAIVKEVIRFRSRVLLKEKEKRKREIEMERLKTKDKLKKLFEGIKETNEKDTTTVTNMTPEPEISKPAIESTRDEYEEMNDEEYLEYKNFEREEQLEKQYREECTRFKAREVQEREKLLDRLQYLRNYENNLMDNKLKFIEEFRSLLTDPSSSFPATTKSNTYLDSLVNLYTYNYNLYLKTRAQKRTFEQTKDEQDELEEKKQDEQSQMAPPKPIDEFVVAQLVNKKPKTEEPNPSTKIVVADLSEDMKEKIHAKIVGLVREYLGIEDDVLVEVINENLQNMLLNGKKELVNELSEVLDEDADNLVNDLWDFIHSSV